MNLCKKLIITGPTAVGKSSIIAAVRQLLAKAGCNHQYVPEYIEGRRDGLEMLNKYFNKTISVFDFQNYILDYYDDTLSSMKVKKNDVIVFERSPDDGITCYSNLDNAIGRLSNEDFLKLYKRAKQLDSKHNIPSYLIGNNYTFTPIKSIDVKHTSKLIADIARSNKRKNNIFGLYHLTDVLYYRMNKRNRPGEKEAYTHETLASFNEHYQKLFVSLMYGRGIRFASLGELIK